MALLVLCKLILQSCMHSHPVGLDVWFLVGPILYFHTSCVRAAKALARLCGCASSPEPSLVTYVISTIISCAGSVGFRITIWQRIITLYLKTNPSDNKNIALQRVILHLLWQRLKSWAFLQYQCTWSDKSVYQISILQISLFIRLSSVLNGVKPNW